MSKNPIIFQHYNYSPYLKYTLSCVVKNNPDKEIILLGDDLNKDVENFGVRHYKLEDFSGGDLLNEFDLCYKYISGKKFEEFTYGKGWVNFNFKKWFILNNFIRDNNIRSFWIFDSDNMILHNLKNYEEQLSSLNCTTYGNENAIQGIVNNINVIEDYCRCVLKIFNNHEFLEEQKKEFEINHGFGLTMMRVFNHYFRNSKSMIRSPLNHSIPGLLFEECLFLGEDMEMDFNLRFKKRVKKLFFDGFGRFYLKDKSLNSYVELASINLSWVPLDVLIRIYKLKFKSKTRSMPMREFDYNGSIISRIIPYWDKGIRKLNNIKRG